MTDDTQGCGLLSTLYMDIAWGYVALLVISATLRGNLLTSIYFFHYSFLLLLLSWYLLFKIKNCEVLVRGVGYLELTNLSVRSLWYLDELGKDESFYSKLLAVVVYGIMTVLRVVLLSYFAISIYRSGAYSFGSNALASYFFVINILLSSNLVMLTENLVGSYMKYRRSLESE